MEKLTDKELVATQGGVSLWIGVGLGALAIFLAGMIDGIVHPKSCEGGNV